MQATNFWCGWWDLNPHASQRHPLKMVCLPFHHNRLYKILSKKKASFLLVTRRNGAEDRNRTGTDITIRGILSPVRLPVPPPRHIKLEATPRFELGNKGFADLCLTTWLWRRIQITKDAYFCVFCLVVNGAEDEIRTRDVHLGKVTLYH